VTLVVFQVGLGNQSLLGAEHQAGMLNYADLLEFKDYLKALQ
jgi:hypothetical protein